MRLISFFLRYSRRALIIAALAGLLSGACNTALIALINSSLKNGDFLSARTLLYFGGLVLLLPFARFLSELLLARLGQGALLDQRLTLSRSILGVPLQYLESLGAARVLTMLTEDIPAITGALVVIPLICVNATVLLGGLIYLGWLSLPMLLVVVGALLLGISGYQFAMFRAMRPLRRMREIANDLVYHFKAITEGTKELKLHRRRRSEFLSRTLRPAAVAYHEQSMQALKIQAGAASWGQAFIFVVIGLALFAGVKLSGTDTHVMTGYVLVLIYITTPMQFIMNTVPTLGRANIALRNIERLGFDLNQHAEGGAGEPPSPAPDWGSIVLKDVTYTYHGEGEEGSFTLGPLNLTFRQGELVFIVGGNGSGKTTLAKLLTGLYTPESGRVYLDGRPVDEEGVEAYRQYFSAVFSDFHLFQDFPGLETGALETVIEEHLRRLLLSDKVRVKDGKLTTLRLSQGQRKRLALLACYLEDRPIYLFDEWAADQDPYFREVFYQQILPELMSRGKTLFVITHDDRYFHLADCVVKLEYGRVVSQGASSEEARELATQGD
jgi:putative ATP-binding cassette transporter